MKPELIGDLVIAILIIVVGTILYVKISSLQTSALATIPKTPVNNQSNTLFSSTQYANIAYIIFPNKSTSPNAAVVTSDFNLTTTKFQNGSTSVVIKFMPSGTIYNVTVAQGYKLYFIDKFTTDDGIGGDQHSSDDGYALVDPNGYMIYVKYPIPNV
jgi:hypothetical protein